MRHTFVKLVRFVVHKSVSLLICIAIIYFHEDFAHTDSKDLKDGYAASGYAGMIATRVASFSNQDDIRMASKRYA